MDYTSSKFIFKFKKTFRYIFLYGLRRTLIKIQAQYHMKKVYELLPNLSTVDKHNGVVAVIGCGNYAYSNVAYYLNKYKKGVIRACMDLDINKAASLYEKYGLQYYTQDPTKILSDSKIKLVFIASNHASHAEYAIECIKAGKHVHIEKPHVVSQDQLDRLISAMRDHPEVKVFLGFNRPKSKLFHKLYGYMAREPGELMINWFIAGHEIPDDHWYFKESEGGRVLGNLCHWTDLSLHLVGLENAFPCEIVSATPENAKSDFVVSIVFADRSCASFTFSAKGHTFEGVREILNIHKGNLLATLTDFQNLSIDVIDKRYRFKFLHRDHGHESNLINSFKALTNENIEGESVHYLKATGMLFLKIKDAIDEGNSIKLSV